MSEQVTQIDALPARTDVLIIGGGPNGLVMSVLLSELGISNVVVERKTSLPRDPAAHVMRERPVAVLEALGLGETIDKVSPALALDYITWCATLGGREIGKLDFRFPPADAAPSIIYPWKNVPQNILQPVLYAHASARAQACVRFGVKCTGIKEYGDGVIAQLTDEASGAVRSIAATWAVAADGANSPTRAALGIAMEGPGPLGQFHMIHFAADLRPLIENRSGPIYWIHHPEAPGAFIVHEPEGSSVFMTPVFGIDDEVAGLPARLAKALGADVEAEIISIRKWTAHAQVAEYYGSGHVLLLGDAAHRFPPTGGLGLNTGIMEAHNLAWKLALVVKGIAGDGLLDTYEAECKPAAEANTADSLRNQQHLGMIGAVLGRCSTLPELNTRIDALTVEEKERLAFAIESQRGHFAFNGTMPGERRTVRAARIGPVIAPYGEFRLYAQSRTSFTEEALHHLLRMGLDTSFHIMPGAQQAWCAGVETLLMRPDGLVEWSAEKIAVQTIVDFKNALNKLLDTNAAAVSRSTADKRKKL
tara:strand:+ start:17414 stop:19012 length:1599 start_codon:yes stop_codon:yes gene_type:complete